MTVQISTVELPPVCPYCKAGKSSHVCQYDAEGKIEDAWWLCQGCGVHWGFEFDDFKGRKRIRLAKIIPPELPVGHSFKFSPDV